MLERIFGEMPEVFYIGVIGFTIIITIIGIFCLNILISKWLKNEGKKHPEW